MADRKGPAAAAAASTSPTPSSAAPRSTSPYGTRSRNRGARVNYAEDKEEPMDFEYTSAGAGTTSKPADTTTTASSSSSSSSSQKSAAAPSKPPAAVAGRKRNRAAAKTEQRPALDGVRELKDAAREIERARELLARAPMRKEPGLTNMLSFERPWLDQEGRLVADDGTVLRQHDHIYLICEPPGEPYYLARIMEFLHANNDPAQPIDAIRVNWYYRPKDIQRKVTDTRVLFASMHSDTCPLSAIRGKCSIKHRDEIEDLDAYRKERDCFYFERMFDRYIHRYYDVIPTTKVRNVPESMRKALVERWKYLLVEPQRAKELCAQMRECKRCSGYCASADSVHCAVCGESYHMNCVRPPLLKKPTRGFAWACGPCNQAKERQLEARNTPTGGAAGEAEDDPVDEEDEDAAGAPPRKNGTETPSDVQVELLKQQEPTQEQLQFAHMWQMRYLGQHCRVEDALDYDDRIYPRAASRLGPRHQAVIPPWPGRPFEYVKPLEPKKKKSMSKSAQKAEAEAREKRPPWVMDEPPGYIERGQDDGTTSTLLFKVPIQESNERGASPEQQFEEKVEVLDEYMESTKKVAEQLKMDFFATNFMDKAAELLFKNDWQPKKALDQLAKCNPVKDLKEPRLKPDEVKRFEEGVAKFGSELHLVAKHVKTRKEADIVRFYYGWKKTERGREIWGNYEGRRNKKEAKLKDKDASAKLVDDVADDEDDSAFDVEKASQRKRGFECKFCGTRHSRQWRRAPGVAPGTLISTEKPGSHKKKSEEKWLVSALCRRCGELWRRYAIQWEDPEEVAKKMGQGGGRAWKRRIDEELIKELNIAQEDARAEAAAVAAQHPQSVTPQPGTMSGTATPDLQKEPPKKKHKGESNGVKKPGSQTSAEKLKQKEKEKSKEPPPPPPEPPKPRKAPCGVCAVTEEIGKKHVVCRDCRMTVHRRCYGVGETRMANKWVCEMCANDKNPQASTTYECVLCPHQADPDQEPEKNNPYHKSSYKKKAAEKKESPEIDGRKVKDCDKHRPQQPREPLKKTAHNNWAHVICSVFTPEIRFSDPPTLKVVEGVGCIPPARWTAECVVCHASGTEGTGGTSKGACVQCPTCHAFVHVSCAAQAGWTLGFDIQPVKGSRRDTVNIVKIGNETGNMIAGVWCKEHNVKGVHSMDEVVDPETGETALELYARTYKQADLSLTNTVRKANMVAMTGAPRASISHRRNSILSPTHKDGADAFATVFIKTEGPEDKIGGVEGLLQGHVGGEGPKKCMQCGVEASPLWVKASGPSLLNGVTNGATVNGESAPHTNGSTTANRTLGLKCHKCRADENEPNRRISQVNGHRPAEKKYEALPPLQTFLAEQHAIFMKKQAPVLPPPPPLQHPMGAPLPAPHPAAPPLGPQISHQPHAMPPSAAPTIPQSLPPPHPHHPHAVLHHPHPAPIPPPHHVVHHPPPPHVPHPHPAPPPHNVLAPPHPSHHPMAHAPLPHTMSPRAPYSAPSHMSPRTPHPPPSLPSPHALAMHHSPARHHHLAAPHPHHISPPPPYQQIHRPMHPAAMSVGQPLPPRRESIGHAPPVRRESHDPRMEDERRRRESEDRRREDRRREDERRNGRLSGASGSPALANLLS